jgi:hypothetical protein
VFLYSDDVIADPVEPPVPEAKPAIIDVTPGQA